MSPEHITQLILEYRYWILIPLTFLEGPIVAFVAGTLAAGGFFNLYFLAALFFVRDVGLDGAYYLLGYYGGRTTVAERMLKKLHITRDHLEEVRTLWEKRPGRTMFIGKLSYGIASSFIVVAGMVRMRLSVFFGYGSIMAVAQYGSLLLIGYFFGQASGGKIVHILENLQYILAGAAIIFTGYYILSFSMRGKFLKADDAVEQQDNPPAASE